MVYSTHRSKAVVSVLLFVALWFILRGDLFDVLLVIFCSCVFSVLLALRLPRLGKRDQILVLFVRLFDLRLFGFVCFLFRLVSGKTCGRETIASALNDYCTRWCKREQVESKALNNWKLKIFKIIDERVLFYSNNLDLLPPKPKLSFRYLKQGIQEFHRKYFLAPAYKAANNVVVV